MCYVEESRPPLWSSGQSSWLLNGDVLCFLWGTNWIYMCYVEESRPPLWPSGLSSWLQIQRSGFDFRQHQTFWEVVGLERGPISLVSTTGELLDRTSSGSCLENREYGRMDPSRWPRDTLYPQKFALTSLTSGGRSGGIVRSRTQTTQFSKIKARYSIFMLFENIENSCVYILNIALGLASPATWFHAGFLINILLDPEDGDDMFLRNIGWLSIWYPKR
jgi:hypothetical protein